MSVYIPTNNDTGGGVTKAYVNARFASKASIENKLNKPSAAAVSGRLLYTSDNSGNLDYTSFNVLDISNNISNTTSNYNSILALNERIALNRVKVGTNAGASSQGLNAVAAGYNAGRVSQSNQGVAIGFAAGETFQGESSVAVGINSGNSDQGMNSVAIGNQAGFIAQSSGSIAIGYQAGYSNQHANSVVINASGAALNTVAGNRSYIAPIRDDTTNNNVLTYNNATKEVNQNSGLWSGLDSRISTNAASITSLNNRVTLTTVKVGFNAGNNANLNSINIGNTAGTSSGQNSVNIGTGAASLGDNAICIGQNAKSNVNSAIVLNGIGANLTATNNSLYIDPIRNDTTNNNVLTYNATTKEVNQNSGLWSGLDTRITSNTNNLLSYINATDTNTNNITSLLSTVNKTKAYAYAAFNAANQTMINSYNISSITYSATGVFKANFVTGLFSNSNYMAVVSCNKPDTTINDANGVATLGYDGADHRFTSTYVPINCVYQNGNSLMNPTRVCVLVHYNI